MSTDDLLEHYRLNVQVLDDRVIQRFHRRKRGVRERYEVPWVRTQRLGAGAFGQVWREESLEPENQKVRAVKIIDKYQMRTLGVDYKRELLALSKFAKDEYQQQDVLVLFLGWYETEHAVHLTMEYFEHGDLLQYIADISNEREVVQIITDVLCGLQILHLEGFAHRDLKPQNIFVVDKPPQSKLWTVKIGDFGISKRVQSDHTALRTQAGTPHFQAPEILGFVGDDLESSEYSHAIDMWSLGCIVYNLVAGQVPFPRPALLNRFCLDPSRFPLNALSSKLADSGIEFVRGLLVPQPVERMTLESALIHPWIFDSSSESSTHFDQTQPSMNHQFSMPSIDSNATQLSRGPTVEKSRLANTPLPATQITWKESVIMIGHSDDVNDVTFSPDGTLVASGDDRGTIYLWDVATGRSRQPLAGENSVWELTFSLDCTLLASGHKTGEIRLWDVATGQHRNTLIGHSDWVRAVAFSPNGMLLASGSWEGEMCLWEMATGYTRSLPHAEDTIESVAFSPTGTLVASASSRRVDLWDVKTSQHLRLFSHDQQFNESLTFSPDGTMVTLVCGAGVLAWNLKTGQNVGQMTDLDFDCAIALSPDGTLMASAGWKEIILGKVGSDHRYEYAVLDGHSGNVNTAAFSPNGQFLVSGGDDQMVRLCEVHGALKRSFLPQIRS